jgi:hypothetical protein
MQDIILFLAAIITIAAAVPYIRDILRGTTKPNIVSWITWTLLTGTATIAAFVAGEYVVATYTASATLTTASVVLLGLKYGYAEYSRFDKLCQVSVAVAFVLWFTFDSPALAVVTAVVIDAIGALPTIRHAWKNPHEETLVTFLLSAVGGFLALFAISSYNWITLSYPIYIVIVNAIIVGTIIYSKKSKVS